MRNRFLAFLSTAALAAAIMILGPASVVGQAPSSGAKPTKASSWKAPRTPDGQPDLQGYWTNATRTPLERPKGLGTKEFYTPAEMAENQRREQERRPISSA